MHNKNIIVLVYSFLSFPPFLKNTASIEINEFLVDSGCLNTIVTSEDRIMNTQKPDPIVAILQMNGELISVSLVGDLELEKSLPPIENVSVAPECSMNLLSIIEDYSSADLSCFIKKKFHIGKRTIINVI